MQTSAKAPRRNAKKRTKIFNMDKKTANIDEKTYLYDDFFELQLMFPCKARQTDYHFIKNDSGNTNVST